MPGKVVGAIDDEHYELMKVMLDFVGADEVKCEFIHDECVYLMGGYEQYTFLKGAQKLVVRLNGSEEAHCRGLLRVDIR